MTLRGRLVRFYALSVTLWLVAVGGAIYFEFVIEPASAGIVFRGAEPEDTAVGEMWEVIFFAALPAAVLAGIGGWWVLRRGLAPVQALTVAAEALHEGNLHERLPRTHNGDEIDRLSEVLNTLVGRLGASLNQMREFTLQASHELKTPLTIMRGELETALRLNFSQADPQALCASQLEEIRRLTRIVDSLTLLAKADAGLLQLESKPVDLAALVEAGAEDADILAEGRVAVKLERCEPCTVQGDRDRLRQLILNLVDNAVKFSPPGGAVTLALDMAEGLARLRVANTGPVLPPEEAARVFDRFYRAGHDRHSATPGSGLGLSLCQWIVKAHGGTITFQSTAPGVNTVEVVFPVLM